MIRAASLILAFASLFFAFAPMQAHAQTPSGTMTWWCNEAGGGAHCGDGSTYPAGPYADPMAGCNAIAPYDNWGSCTLDAASSTTYVKRYNGVNRPAEGKGFTLFCGAKFAHPTSGCIDNTYCTGSNTASGGVCGTPNPCAPLTNTTTTGEWFSNYQNAATGAVIGTPNVPTSACISGCYAGKDSAQGNAGVIDCYSYASNVSKVFCTWGLKYDGTTCTGTTSNGSPSGLCPTGYTYGSVNGKWGCYASSQTVVAGTPPPSTTTVTAGSGQTPSSPTGTGDQNSSNQSGTGAGAGAGGPGGTSSSGTGGSNSGVASAGSPKGTDADPLKVDPSCGVPGKPNCNVKVDETGTPTTSTATDAAKGQIDTTHDQRVDKITDVTKSDGKDTTWGWAFPSIGGACTPIVLGEYVVDHCGVVSTLKAIVAFLWWLGTCIACSGMVKRAVEA